LGVLCTLLACEVIAANAYAQTTTTVTHADESVMSGTVVSYSGSTLVIRTDAGTYHLFTFDRLTVKPATVTPGTVVRVTSRSTAEPNVRLATSVTAPGAQGAAGDPVPTSIRELEGQIQKQVRKWGVGLRAGAGMDQEVLLIGAHARLGPFFSRDFSFRP